MRPAANRGDRDPPKQQAAQMTAPTHIDALVDKALRQLPPHVREKFATDPHAALRDLGLTARQVAHLTDRRNDGGACDCVSFLHDNVILYAPLTTPAT